MCNYFNNLIFLPILLERSSLNIEFFLFVLTFDFVWACLDIKCIMIYRLNNDYINSGCIFISFGYCKLSFKKHEAHRALKPLESRRKAHGEGTRFLYSKCTFLLQLKNQFLKHISYFKQHDIHISVSTSLKTFIILAVNTTIAQTIIVRIWRIPKIIFFFEFLWFFLKKQRLFKLHIQVNLSFEFYFFFEQTSIS